MLYVLYFEFKLEFYEEQGTLNYYIGSYLGFQEEDSSVGHS